MTNQSQDITDKHWQRQLLPLKCKQNFCDTIAWHPRRRNNINPLTMVGS